MSLPKAMIYLLLLAAAVAGALVFQQSSATHEISALYYEQPRQLKPFQLTDHNKQPFTTEQLKGKWTFVFTGYTYCPDICPTTMAMLNKNYQELSQLTDNQTQVMLVSVDPKRDNAERLAEYIAYFNPEFVAATAEHKQLFPFVRNLGLMYAMSDTEEENYLVDHSAAIVLLNPDGNIQAIFKPQHAVGKIPSVDFSQLKLDFKQIVTQYD